MEANGLEGGKFDAPTIGEGPKKERLKPRRAIHFLLERIKTHPEAYSEDLIECLAQPWWGELVHGDFIHPDYYQFLNHKNLAKELTEAWASYVKVKQLLSRINPNYRVEPSSSSSSIDSTCSTTTTSATAEADDAVELYLFDMCSGKGFNVFIISKMLPGQFTKIYAIDKDQKMNLEHFNSLGGVKFKYADVHHRRFNEWISRKLGAEGGNEGNRKLLVEKDSFNPLSLSGACPDGFGGSFLGGSNDSCALEFRHEANSTMQIPTSVALRVGDREVLVMKVNRVILNPSEKLIKDLVKPNQESAEKAEEPAAAFYSRFLR